MTTQYVYRLVVDSYPTENGEPFSAQDFDFWADIVNAAEEGLPVPEWVPDLKPWLARFVEDELFGGLVTPDKDGYQIGYGDEYLMNVPFAPNRRFLSGARLPRMLADLVAWGCVAHIERAPIGEWSTHVPRNSPGGAACPPHDSSP